MFIDRTIVVGILVSLGGLALITVVLLLVLTDFKTPQVVRLVALAPSPGSVILEDTGDTATLTVQGYYSDLSLEDLDPSSMRFESSDPRVVTVSSNGVVTAGDSGFADILIEFGGLNKRVHALVFGEIPKLPAIDPADVGVIPGLDSEVRAVLNRAIIKLQPGSDADSAAEIAASLGGKVLFSYTMSPTFLIEFDSEEHNLLEVLAEVESDPRVAEVHPDSLFENFDHEIDSLSLDPTGGSFRLAGFEGAWRIMEDVPLLNPVIISVMDDGGVKPRGANEPSIVRSEFDPDRIKAYAFGNSTEHATAVTSIIAAINHGAKPPSQGNMSGIVTSVEDFPYQLISLSRNWFLVSAVPTNSLFSASMVLVSLELLNRFTPVLDVVNMSWGSIVLGPLFSDEILAMSSVAFVPGAGNCQVNAALIAPANLSLVLPHVITVGGANADYDGRRVPSNGIPTCKRNGVQGNSSAYGEAVTIAAPSEGVRVIDIASNGLSHHSGTSLAAPMVTGTIALLKAIDAEIPPSQLRDLLVDTADKKDICTTTDKWTTGNCADEDIEEWHFLRADKAVAQLISDRVDAEIFQERVTVPSETQRIVNSPFEVGVEIKNTGKIVWPFYAEAFVRSPTGSETSLGGQEIAIAPDEIHPFRWGFYPSQEGCWDLQVRVRIDDDRSSHLRAAMVENKGSGASPDEVGMIAESEWWEDLLEVRSDAEQEIECSSEIQAVPLPTGLTQIDANVLLLADTSGSMQGQKIEALKQAVQTFVNRMHDIQFQGKGGADAEADYVGLSDFDDNYEAVIPIGLIDSTEADLDAWQDAVDRLSADGGTAFYDAIITSVDILTKEGAPARNNILIALTDGLDQGSQHSFDDAVAALNQASITLFALALGEPGGSGDYDLEILTNLANSTGGAAYIADTGNLSGLYLLFSTIFEIGP